MCVGQGSISSLIGALQIGLDSNGLNSARLLATLLSEASAAAEAELEEAMRAPQKDVGAVPASEIWVARHMCTVLTRGGCADEVRNTRPERKYLNQQLD